MSVRIWLPTCRSRRAVAAVALIGALGCGTASCRIVRGTPQVTQTDVTPEQGVAALKANRPELALQIFQQVLQKNPADLGVNLLAATAALDLYKGPLAVQYAEKARQLAPANWRINTTLVAAYAAAGMKAQRDAERAELEKLHHDASARDAEQSSGFLLEMFPAGAYRVDAVQYFTPMERFHIYYRFLVRDQDGKRVWEIDAESNDFDEASWATAHPELAAAGDRQFQLTGEGNGGEHVDYEMFSGKPDYDRIRAMVVRLVQEQAGPFPGKATSR